MISKKSLLADQLSLLKRRLWVLLFTALPVVIIYPAAALLVLTGVRASFFVQYEGRGGAEQAAALSARLLNNAVDLLSMNFLTVFVVVILAVFIGLQGYAWMFSRQQTDFYESQPVSRKKRFFTIYANGMLIFFLVDAVCLLLTFLAGCALGVPSGALLAETGYALLRDVLLFFAVYAIAVLGAMLTGNMVHAFAMTWLLLLVQHVVNWLRAEYMRIFFKTFAEGYAVLHYVFPAPFSEASALYEARDIRLAGGGVVEDVERAALLTQGVLTGLMPHLLALALIGSVTLLLSFATYRARKAEWAGKTICFYPVHVLTKFVTAILIGMTAGLIVQQLVFYDTRVSMYTFGMAVVMMAACAVAGLFGEAIYRGSVKGAFRKAGHIPVICALAFLILLAFRLDLTGYDHYLPGETIADCAILNRNTSGAYLHVYNPEQRELPSNALPVPINYDEYRREIMRITDTEGIRNLMEAVYARQAAEPDAELSASYGYDCIFLFRTQRGGEVVRRIVIPYDMDTALMERIFAGEEYLRGAEEIFQAEQILPLMEKDASLRFRGGYRTSEALDARTFFEEFASCYRKDLEQYTFAEAQKTQMLGVVCLEGTLAEGNASVSMPGVQYQAAFGILPSYTESIRFLEAQGIPVRETVRPEDVESIIVTNFYPGQDETAGLHLNNYSNYSRDKAYSRKEEIAEILANVVDESLTTEWYDMRRMSEQFYAEFRLRELHGVDREFLDGWRIFIRGGLPAFIAEDPEMQ